MKSMKFPEETISNMAQLLPQTNLTNDPANTEHQRNYSVEELAIAANTTVRNIRAYQDRGVLPPNLTRAKRDL